MKTDEIASIVLLIFAIIAGICTQWWVGLIIFVIGAVLIDKYIGFSKDETPSDNYYENKFYRNSDWPNIYRLDDYYKETILAPFRELLGCAPEELEFIGMKTMIFTSDKQTATVIHTA